MTAEVLVEVQGGVMTISLNRPDVRNAVNGAVARGIADALVELDTNEALRVGILTGKGPSFCSGMDLRDFLENGPPFVPGRGFAGLVESPPRTPLIAAVEGYAIAGGFEIVLACDLIVAARDALFGLPEVTRGLCAAAGGLLRLPRRIPYHIAMECALTGTLLTADRAERLGLINALVDPGQALDRARTLASTIASNGPLAVATSKEIISSSQDWDVTESFVRQRELVRPVLRSIDAKEGAAAFLESRPPVWRGR